MAVPTTHSEAYATVITVAVEAAAKDTCQVMEQDGDSVSWPEV